MNFLFETFDLDSDGVLKRDELRSLLCTVARASTKLELAFASTDGIAIELAVASALDYAGQAGDMTTLADSLAGDLEDIESSDGEEEKETKNSHTNDNKRITTVAADNTALSESLNDELPPQTQITQKEFLLWAAKDRVSCQFRALCSIASRARALVQLWERRAKSLSVRNIAHRVRPRWAIAAAGVKGSRNARVAQHRAFSLATVAFVAAPFLVALSKQISRQRNTQGDRKNGCYLCDSIRVRLSYIRLPYRCGISRSR